MRLDERGSALLLPLMYRAMHRPYQAQLIELHANERLDEERLAELQWQRLSALIAHCYEQVPYYRTVFDRLGAKPQDIRSLADFARLPALDKPTLKANTDALIAANHDRTELEAVTTGGSSGIPVQLFYDADYFDRGWSALLRNMSWTGFRPGERQAWVTREATGGWKRELRLAIERKWVAGVVVQTPDTIAQWADKLARWQPRLVYSTPSSRLPALSHHLLEHDIRLDGVRAVMTSSETLLDANRELIERAFGAKVFNQYGSTECLSMAAECEAGSMHVNADVNLIEHVPVPSMPGVNEMIVTPLFAYGMPLLRYRLGDLGSPIEGRCACGRTLPRIGSLEGRLTGTATLSDGTVLTSFALEELLQSLPGVAQFQFRQVAPDAFDLLVITTHTDDAAVAASLDGIEDVFARRNGVRASIRVVYVDDIPLTAAGKHLYLVPLDTQTPR